MLEIQIVPSRMLESCGRATRSSRSGISYVHQRKGFCQASFKATKSLSMTTASCARISNRSGYPSHLRLAQANSIRNATQRRLRSAGCTSHRKRVFDSLKSTRRLHPAVTVGWHVIQLDALLQTRPQRPSPPRQPPGRLRSSRDMHGPDRRESHDAWRQRSSLRHADRVSGPENNQPLRVPCLRVLAWWAGGRQGSLVPPYSLAIMRSAQFVARQADEVKQVARFLQVHRHAARNIIHLAQGAIRSEGGMAIGSAAPWGRNSLLRLSLPLINGVPSTVATS